ncbi:MAG: SAM-dependent methyltransferase, partial [Rubrivivax sp.]|nr:SAM-dependent methyltransferase [Rubrivivax sp.]
WLSLYQLLAAHPDGQVEGRTLPGAQSAYPFQRAYMYGGSRDEHH